MKPDKKYIAIAKAILADLSDRSGIGNAIDDCDKDTKREILRAIAEIIQEHIES